MQPFWGGGVGLGGRFFVHPYYRIPLSATPTQNPPIKAGEKADRRENDVEIRWLPICLRYLACKTKLDPNLIKIREGGASQLTNDENLIESDRYV